MAAARGPYIALIGDLVRSRDLDPHVRGELQRRLRERFDALNEDFGRGLRSRLLLTLGDEFQGLFDPGPDGARLLVRTLTEVTEDCLPGAVRFGVGVGPLSTELRHEALGMDGPCFHRARKALEIASARKQACRLVEEGSSGEAVWSLLATVTLRRQAGWSDAQRKAVHLRRRLDTGKAVAEALGIGPSAVSMRLRAAEWDLHRESLRSLEDALVDLNPPDSSAR
ncbi:MAG: SatD family protein [Myxococcota bacterium]